MSETLAVLQLQKKRDLIVDFLKGQATGNEKMNWL